MRIECVWEHNGGDTLLYVSNYPGAFTRGASPEEALKKLPLEIETFCAWAGLPSDGPPAAEITQERQSSLCIRDADSEVLFDTERDAPQPEEYARLKRLALKSAEDFLTLYESVPDKTVSALPGRKTFYGSVPRTAEEMYLHTKNVNSYYFGEIGIDADNEGTIAECRRRGFELLEQRPEFLKPAVYDGSWGEQWSLKKLLRRFLWHDRIHARAMYRMAVLTFGRERVDDPFGFRDR